jgi:outer membrane receptor protein involved in Fe transport
LPGPALVTKNVLSNDALHASGFGTLPDSLDLTTSDNITWVVNFSGNTEDGFTDALSMRGISTNDFGIGGDPSVAMFVDGFWAGRTGGVMTAMYDIERTEVVKGPQGTLFGRNSIAGAVSVITKKPEPNFAASAELTLADWDHVEANAMVNVPLGDQWALRVAGYVLDNQGFLKNDQGGDKLGFHQTAGRVSLAHDGDNFDATLTRPTRTANRTVRLLVLAGPARERVNTDLGDSGIDESNVLTCTPPRVGLRRRLFATSLTGYKKFLPLSRGLTAADLVNNYGGERCRILEPGVPLNPRAPQGDCSQAPALRRKSTASSTTSTTRTPCSAQRHRAPDLTARPPAARPDLRPTGRHRQQTSSTTSRSAAECTSRARAGQFTATSPGQSPTASH